MNPCIFKGLWNCQRSKIEVRKNSFWLNPIAPMLTMPKRSLLAKMSRFFSELKLYFGSPQFYSHFICKDPYYLSLYQAPFAAFSEECGSTFRGLPKNPADKQGERGFMKRPRYQVNKSYSSNIVHKRERHRWGWKKLTSCPPNFWMAPFKVSNIFSSESTCI